MKLSFLAFACTLGLTAASKARKLSPSVKVRNSVYSGEDFGIGCGQLGKKSISENTKTPVVYCFEVINTGNTRLNNVVLTNSALDNFFDNSIHHLEPGASKMVPFIHKVDGDLVNNVVVTATPVHSDGKPIEDVKEIKATDSSEVIDVVARHRKLNLDSKRGYASPISGLSNCIQTQWEASGNSGDLICAKRDAYLFSLAAQEDSTCVEGYTSTLTIDASIVVALDTMFDLGWYIDTSGGDAMGGSSCVVNGFIETNEYNVFNAKAQTVPFGDIYWRPDNSNGGGGATFQFDDDSTDDGAGGASFGGGDDDAAMWGAGAKAPDDLDRKVRKQRKLQFGDDAVGDDAQGDDAFSGGSDDNTVSEGDGDECGDVYLLGEDEAVIPIPIAVEVTLACEDQNEDGFLDFSICFTWRKNGADDCTFATNVSRTSYGWMLLHPI